MQLLSWKGILTRFGASKLNPSSLSHSVMFGNGKDFNVRLSIKRLPGHYKINKF